VLLLVAHPCGGSLCNVLADVYAEGAQSAGTDPRCCDLAAFRFEPNVTHVLSRDQPCVDNIRPAMQAIAWANHSLIVFPTWWGTMPAVLQGFLDRVMLPGFVFAERADGEGRERLLAGRSAHLLRPPPRSLALENAESSSANYSAVV
jgi:putative NADPH-quinone reductase